MKPVTLEDAWAVLKSENFKYAYADGCICINPDSVLVGRAVTATFMPGRPDVHRVIDKKGHEKDGRVKSQNTPGIPFLNEVIYTDSCTKNHAKCEHKNCFRMGKQFLFY